VVDFNVARVLFHVFGSQAAMTLVRFFFAA
jgi:hypothetical protein